ncbi:MAG TPA: tol-pal system protein YbgF [Rhizomicrobium sp.]|jgi:tol-pal system protein YbgF
MRSVFYRYLAIGAALCALNCGAAASDPAPTSLEALKLRISAAEAHAALLSGDSDHIAARTDQTKLAQLFGESDEEKAARQQHEQAQDSGIAALNQRIQDLADVDDSLRRLTGQIEQLDHRLTEMNERISRMQREFDYKLCALAAQQLGASSDSTDQGALPCNGQGQPLGAAAPGGGAAPPASGAPVHLAPPPGVLGTLPRGDSSQTSQPSQDQLASIDTRPQFESALNLLGKAQYDEARAAFRGFADTYPRDDLAPQAVYWVGDIAYVQKDYASAARAFAEELKKYPTSPRAPESLLKLGQSLIAMNQKKEGCTALGALASRYPTASKSVSEQALSTRRAAGCR